MCVTETKVEAPSVDRRIDSGERLTESRFAMYTEIGDWSPAR